MQENKIAIQVTNLGKCFHIYDRPQDRLKQIFSLGKKRYYRDFWALKDINFTVHRGESFGIIGRNGAGKSTLLQLLCKTLTPTIGNIKINGRVAALLELGAGFNPEFTGEENIYMNGAILGLSRKEMAEHIDEILAFADIGNFIHQPVKTYSSGMFVRLAFAVQAHVSPDILIIDEALSVGDIFFQQKCAKRMQALRESGTTLIFVSHDMSTVRDLCENALYLRAGKVMFSGQRVEAIRRYFAETEKDEQPISNSMNTIQMVQKPFILKIITEFKQSAYWLNPSATKQKKEANLIAVQVLDENGNPTTQTKMTHKLIFRVLYQSFTDRTIDITIVTRNQYDHVVNANGTYINNFLPPTLSNGEFAICEIELTCMIEPGPYTFAIFLGYNILPNRGKCIDESPWLGPLTINWDHENEKAPMQGMFGLPAKINITELST